MHHMDFLNSYFPKKMIKIQVLRSKLFESYISNECDHNLFINALPAYKDTRLLYSKAFVFIPTNI